MKNSDNRIISVSKDGSAQVQEGETGGRRILTSRQSSFCPQCDIRCCVLKQEIKIKQPLFPLSGGCMGMFKTYSAGDVLPFKTIKHLILSTISDSANLVCVYVCVSLRRSSFAQGEHCAFVFHLKQPWEKNTHYIWRVTDHSDESHLCLYETCCTLTYIYIYLYIFIYIFLFRFFISFVLKLETGWVTFPSITGIWCVYCVVGC